MILIVGQGLKRYSFLFNLVTVSFVRTENNES